MEMATNIPPEVLEYLAKFCNYINGSMAAGLAGQGDPGLKESEKLTLAHPALIYRAATQEQSTSMWTLVATHAQQSRALTAMAHAALVASWEGLRNR